MSIVARLDLDRSDRIVVARAATLRDHHMGPTDIILDDLSTSGCRISVDMALELGTVISIGIPGIGNCFAEICRAEQPIYGCLFLKPVTSAEISIAQTAQTVVRGNFPMRDVPAIETVPEVAIDDQAVMPVAQRAAVVIGVSSLLWAGIIASVWVLSQ
jgi:hypothetical protein